MKIYKRKKFEAAHKLKLPYNSACNNLHGHSYLCEIEIEGPLNKSGMVLDFQKIGEIINNFDHKYLNDILPQPTAENLVLFILSKLKDEVKEGKIKVRIHETETSYAEDEAVIE